MRRIQLVLGALAIVVTSFAAFSGPAMADDLNCRDAKGDLIRCDGDLYAPYNNYWNGNYWNGAYWGDNWWDNSWDDDDFEDYWDDYQDAYQDYLDDHVDSNWSWNHNW